MGGVEDAAGTAFGGPWLGEQTLKFAKAHPEDPRVAKRTPIRADVLAVR
jgi:hypothetical protein